MIAFLVSAPLRLLRFRGPLAAMRPGSQTAQPLHSEPPVPSRHAVEFVRGLVQTPVHRWLCDRCRRPVSYLNRRQREQWLNKEPVECRGW